jgi:hypothetical protein
MTNFVVAGINRKTGNPSVMVLTNTRSAAEVDLSRAERVAKEWFGFQICASPRELSEFAKATQTKWFDLIGL